MSHPPVFVSEPNLTPSDKKLISQEKAADTTLGKNPDDGLYLRYCSLPGLFVSGSRCLPYRGKLGRAGGEVDFVKSLRLFIREIREFREFREISVSLCHFLKQVDYVSLVDERKEDSC